MKRKLYAGQSSVTLPIFVRDTSSSTGAGLSGLTSGSSGLVGEYRRRGSSSWTAITLTSATLGTYTSGGWVADGSLAGAYEVGVPDLALATGARWVAIRYYGAANMAPVLIEIELDAINYQDGIRGGLTALPGVNAEAAGGLITRGSGTGQMLVLSGQVNIGGIANGVITSNAFASGAITSSVLASGAITSTTFASGAITSSTFGSGIFPTNFPSMAITAGGAVTAGTVSDKTGYSLTQSFPSNFASMAITVGGAVTAGTVSDKTGYSLATAPPTASAIATQVWSETVPGSYTSGQAGNVLGNVATGTPPTAAAIADAVWDEPRSGHTTTGTFGENVLATNTAGAALATASALSSVASDVTAILDDTGTSGVVVASGSKTGYSLSSSQTFNLTGNITGNLSGSVGSVATGGITSSSFAAGAIDAAAIAADAIGASELATSAVSEIATAVLTTQMTESYASDGVAPTLAQAVFLTMQGVTEFAIAGTTVTVKKLDGSTTAATFTLDSSTTPTSRTRAS